MTKPDSVNLRITYTIPIQSGDEATLHVRVKQASVSSAEQFFGLTIEVLEKDAGVGRIFGPETRSPAHPGGPFDQTFELKVPVSKLNEDAGGTNARDEVLVRVKKTANAIIQTDSDWVYSNQVNVYFGKGEITP